MKNLIKTRQFIFLMLGAMLWLSGLLAATAQPFQPEVLFNFTQGPLHSYANLGNNILDAT